MQAVGHREARESEDFALLMLVTSGKGWALWRHPDVDPNV
jgi:hypothetical protein